MKKLGFGLMRLPRLDAGDRSSVDIETLCRMADEFIENGFTYFDTAWMYCGFNSERAVKTALVERYPRDAFVLATKFHAAFAKESADVDRIFNEQLEKTGAGYFDRYLLHDLSLENYEKCEEFGAFETLLKRRDAGEIKRLGCSFHDTPEVLERVLTEHPELEFVQLQINYLDWESPAIRARECYEVATRHGVPVIVMEPVKGGTLAKMPESVEREMRSLHPDWSTASWAIRFAASLENVEVVLSGMSSLEQMRDNISFMKDFTPLSDGEVSLLLRAADELRKNPFIPCTGCAYCVDGCPQNIAIPKYFSLYNEEKRNGGDGGWSNQREYYDNLTRHYGAAGDCIGCEQCQNICPQHIRIVGKLKEIADYFGK